MFELNAYNLLLIPSVLALLFFVHARLRKCLEYRNIPLRMPTLTGTLWSELKFSWLVGMMLPKDVLPFFSEQFKILGPIFNYNLIGRSYVLLNDPDDLKELLSSAAYNTKGVEYDLLRPWLNTGLLLSSGEKWKSRRKLLTKAFHFSTLNKYIPSINKHSRVLVKKLLAASAGGKEIVISDYVTLCSLDIICETIMGTELDAQEGKSSEYVRSIKNACKSVFERIFKMWLWSDLLFGLSSAGRRFNESIRVLHGFTDDVIKQKRIAFNNSKDQNGELESTKNQSFLELLLAVLEGNPDQMTDKDIREEVDTFLFEGHDTSSISIVMTLILLSMHQNIQDKTRNELFDIFGDSDRDATIEDLNAMKYLDAVIRESLRLYPSVPAISRQLETTLKLKNYSIPPNVTIVVISHLVHRNENIYANAEEFIPERFLDNESKNKFLFGYIPFSAGPRNCIGQKYAMNQMKIVISTVLRKMKIETSATKEDIVISLQLVLRLESTIKLKFHEI